MRGLTEEIAPGIRHVAVAPGWLFNAYLVGDVLVDSGPWFCRPQLLRWLHGQQVNSHLLTHAHGDHDGSTRLLAESFALPVWVGDADREALEAGHLARHGNPVTSTVMRLAVPARGCGVDRALAEGDGIPGGFEVLSVPGHTPGSVALWRERDRVLVCGDAAWNVLRGPGMVPLGLSTDAEQARRSWRRLAGLRPRLTLFGHGRPVRDQGLLDRN